jgi:hypothetical protein
LIPYRFLEEKGMASALGTIIDHPLGLKITYLDIMDYYNI